MIRLTGARLSHFFKGETGSIMAEKETYEQLVERINHLESELEHLKGNGRHPVQGVSEDFKRLADRSLDAIYHFNVVSRGFIFFNKLFSELYGLGGKNKKEITTKSVLLRIHPDDRKNVKEAGEKSLHPGTRQGEVEYRFLHPDGSQRWMHDQWIVLRDIEGHPYAIEGFIRDNTERRQAQEELEQSRRSALIGSYIVQNGQFSYVNPEFRRITGYSEKELLGLRSMDLVQKDYQASVRENAVRMLKGGQLTPYEFCISTKSKEKKWIMETVTPVHHKGHRAVLGYFMDITQSKKADEERLEKERLQSALEKEKAERMAAIGRIVAGMAHYIKNILTGLRGGAFIVDNAIRKEDFSTIKDGWEMVRRNLAIMTNIVQDMLIYSTERKPKYRLVNPKALALDVMGLVCDTAKLSNVKLTHDFVPGIQNIYMDPSAIHRCLLNLINNAVDACTVDEGNTENAVVAVTTDRPLGWGVRFRITDNGIGMDRETQNSMFSDFFSTKGYKGTGLGLPVTQKIISEHNGELSCSSTPGEGTTFTVLLPDNQ
jgi:PAS domain S-box-containing protein